MPARETPPSRSLWSHELSWLLGRDPLVSIRVSLPFPFPSFFLSSFPRPGLAFESSYDILSWAISARKVHAIGSSELTLCWIASIQSSTLYIVRIIFLEWVIKKHLSSEKSLFNYINIRPLFSSHWAKILVIEERWQMSVQRSGRTSLLRFFSEYIIYNIRRKKNRVNYCAGTLRK